MGQYNEYICTKLYKRENLPGPTPAQRDILAREGLRISMEHILWLDSDVIPGCFYGESTYIWPASYPGQIDPLTLAKRYTNAKPMFPHEHEFPEILSWWGCDPDHPEDTTTMGMVMDDEEIYLDRSWVAYVPAGMKHMPTRPAGGRVSSKPVVHWTSGPGIYTREADHSPKTDQDAQKNLVPLSKNEYKRGPNLKNARYFVYDYKKDAKRLPFMKEMDPKYSRPVAYIDQSVIPDAEFGCDAWWLLPRKTAKEQVVFEKHSVPYGATITLTAMNYADITDLSGEAELWIGGEKHLINKNFGAYLPPDTEAGPLIVRGLSQQTFFLMSYPIGDGIRKYRGG